MATYSAEEFFKGGVPTPTKPVAKPKPKKDALQVAEDVANVFSFGAGKTQGQAIGTLGGIGLTRAREDPGGVFAKLFGAVPRGASKYYDTSAPTPLQVSGDAGVGLAMAAGVKAPIARAAPEVLGGFGGRGAATALGPATTAAKTLALGKNIGTGAAAGYVADVGGNLKEGQEGAGAFKPGLGTALGAAAAPLGGAVTNKAKALGEVPGEIAGTMKQGAAQKSAEKAENFALEFTSQKLNKELAKSAIRQGSSRVKEKKNVFGRTELVPNARDIRIADSVKDVVSHKKRMIENVDAINRKINTLNKGVGEYIRDNKAPFNENQLRTKLAKAKAENNLLFAGDEASEKAYDAVMEEFIRQIGKKDTEGLFQARQGFDQYIKSKLPNAFKKDATGQFLDPRDNIRTNAVLDVRRAANEYIDELLPEGNPYKATLRQETDMLEALSRIADKNAGKISKTNLKLLINRHPILAVIGTGALSGLGISIAGNAVRAAAE